MSGPAGALMRARGLEVSPDGVAAAYAPWLSTLVIDTRDSTAQAALAGRGVRAIVAETIMTDRASEVVLARAVVAVAAS